MHILGVDWGKLFGTRRSRTKSTILKSLKAQERRVRNYNTEYISEKENYKKGLLSRDCDSRSHLSWSVRKYFSLDGKPGGSCVYIDEDVSYTAIEDRKFILTTTLISDPVSYNPELESFENFPHSEKEVKGFCLRIQEVKDYGTVADEAITGVSEMPPGDLYGEIHYEVLNQLLATGKESEQAVTDTINWLIANDYRIIVKKRFEL